MAQQVDEQKAEANTFWPTSLLLNQTYAMTFACTKCKTMPMLCMNNEEGDILCAPCAKNMDNIAPNKAVQKFINSLKTRCLSLAGDNPQKSDNDIEGSNVLSTQAKDNECDWSGTISEWQSHCDKCRFVVIKCTECKTFKTQRQLMDKHVAECPQASIDCPLACGSVILRENTETHLLNDCSEQRMDCANDDCKMQIKRKDFDDHVNNECDVRMIECEFVKYGCSVKQIKANALKKHMDEFKFDHISNKFDFITNGLTNQFNSKIMQQNETIAQLQQNNTKLQQSNNSLTKELSDFKTLHVSQYNTFTNKITEIEEKKEPSLWKNAVYSNTDTGIIATGGVKCLIHMILPQKAGKYVCKYSTLAKASASGTYWIYWYFKLGDTNLAGLSGLYLYKYCESYAFPLSGSVIVQLNGNESDAQRKLGLWHYPQESYPSGMAHCTLEAYQIE